MAKRLHFLLGALCFLLVAPAHAQQNAYCTPPQSQIDIDINNVRARIIAGGDMWWNLQTSHYEVPKGSGKTSMFNGGLWIGGLDGAGNLHVAASTYRQTGNDFWSGPLDTIGGFTSDSSCGVYDRIWKVNRADVESFIANRNDPNYVIPEEILSWPGNGSAAWGHAHQLAPYVDANGNGVYDPQQGDYPAFNFSGQNNCSYDLLGDQALWWVFNDRGNTHTETGSAAFGLEIQATAFAFRSQEEALNNATFYRYKIINRSTVDYSDMWFGVYSDYDLGDPFDDFVGCDVARGLGYCYNGDANDGATAAPGVGTYGAHPPAIGVDILSGPLADANDGIDNDRDSLLDEPGERYILSNSVFYGSDFTVLGNPETGQHFYYRLQTRWKDGSHATYGGNGYGGTVNADFMFPGTSDPQGWGTGGNPQPGWDEISAGNFPGDRRQLHSVGPFTLQAGEADVITVAVPWARDTSGNNFDAIAALQAADDVVQSLFDNCFSLPCAAQPLPEISFTYANELAYFTLLGGGTSWSWNFGDGQTSSAQHPSHFYTTPGTYTITVAVTSACGTFSDTATLEVPDYLRPCGPYLTRIEGQGNGNMELEFTKETIDEILSSPDQRSLFPVYMPMRGPVKVTYEDYHHLEDGEYRIALDSIGFSSGWKLWKVGGTDTVYSDTSIGSGNLQRIAMWGLGVQMQQVKSPGYNNNPVNNGYLTASISFSDASKSWLSGITDSELDEKENWIRAGTRNAYGACISEFNDRFNGSTPIDPDEEYESILGGTWAPYRLVAYNLPAMATNVCYKYGPAWTPSPLSATTANRLENIANVDVIITGDKTKWTRCPVIETGQVMALNEGEREAFHLRAALSVDKNGRNVDNGGLSDPQNPEAADYIGANGMGWFPGYAVNLETGERLNMAFGENSALVPEHGRDMLWNPTENEYHPFEGNLWGGCHYIYVLGHNGDATYTTGSLIGELKDIPLYDAGKAAYTILASDNTANPELREVYSDAMWTTIPVLTPGHSFMESDVTVKLRVQKPYAAYRTDSVAQNRNYPLYGFSIDRLNLTCNEYLGDAWLFPNPFTEQTTIYFENTSQHKAKLQLYDVQGRIVREYNSVSDRIVIEAAGLNPGMYVYTLEVEGVKPRTGKIILNP